MKDQLITFETAKFAKEKGFDIPVYHHYGENMVNDLINLYEADDPQGGFNFDKINFNQEGWLFPKWSAPTQSLLQRYLREVHNIHVECFYDFRDKTYSCTISIDDNWYDSLITKKETYEQSLELGLLEALKLIKK